MRLFVWRSVAWSTLRNRCRLRKRSRTKPSSAISAVIELLDARQLLSMSAITDVNSAANRIIETVADGATVGVTAKATSGRTVTYALPNDSGGGFRINAKTGVITVANGSQIDFERAASHTITVQATDGLDTKTANFTITVTDVKPTAPIDIDSTANQVLENALTGTPVGVVANASDPKGGAISYSLANNAGGRFGIDSITGVVSVANGSLLDFETTRSHSITVIAKCGASSSATKTITIAILNVNELAPTVPTDSNASPNRVAENVAARVSVGITVRSVDPDGLPITYRLTDDADGRFVINATTGVVTVSANASLLNFETATSHTITVQASDGTKTSTASFVISVTNIAPTGFADANAAVNQVLENAATGTLVGITMSAFDPHGGPLLYSLLNNAGGRFQIDSASGLVSVANGSLLNFEANKSHQITAVVTDGTAPPLSKALTIAVLPGNDAPVLISTTVSATAITEDAPTPTKIVGQLVSAFIRLAGTTGVRVTDEDVGAITGMAVIGADTTNGTWFFSTNNGTTWTPFPTLSATNALLLAADTATRIYFQPRPNFNGSNPESLLFRAWDRTRGVNGTVADTLINGGSTAFSHATATVSLVVNPVNDAPVGTGESFTVNEDGVLAGSVLGNDTDIDSDPLTAELVGGPSHALSFTLNPDGTFSYTPAGNFNGTDSFTYKANDGTTNSNVVTVSLTINPVNDAPVGTGESFTVNEDGVLAGSVLGNDTDIDSDPLTAVLVTGPSHALSFTLNPDGSFNFTPTANFNGSDAFTYKANDGTTNSNVVTVSLTINPVNDAPVATGESFAGNEDDVLTGSVLGNDTDIDSDPLTAVLVAEPSHGTLTLNSNGTFSFAPTPNFNGSDSFTYKTNDGTADSNVVTVSITITAVNDAPSLIRSLDDIRVLEGTVGHESDLAGRFSDVDGEPVTATVVSNTNPGLVTTEIVGNALRLTFAANQFGEATITLRAIDQTGALVDADLRVFVEAAPPTLAELDLVRARFVEIANRATNLSEQESEEYEAAGERLIQIAAVAKELEDIAAELRTSFVNATAMSNQEYRLAVESLFTELQAALVKVQTEIQESNLEFERLLTAIRVNADLTVLTVVEGNREVRGAVPLGNAGLGQITFVVPRGSASTASSLQSEMRWTEPPLVTLATDAQLQITIPESVVDWGTRTIQGFGATSVDAQGNLVGGTVWNQGLGAAVVTDMRTGEVRRLGNLSGSTDMTLSADGTRAATTTYGTSGQGTLRIWDLATGSQIGETQNRDYISQVTFRPGSSPDLVIGGRYEFSVSWQKAQGDGDRIFSEVWPYFAVSESVAAAPRLENLGGGNFGPGQTVELYDFINERAMPALPTGDTVKGLAISPDGSLLLTWDATGAIAVWDIATRDLITTISASGRDVKAQFAAEGRVLVITDNTGTLREFSVAALRDGENEPLAQRAISLLDVVLVHPHNPEMFLVRAEKGVGKITTVGLSNVETRGERHPAVEARGGGTVWIDHSSVSGLVTAATFRIVSAPAGTQFRVTPFSGTTTLPTIEAQPGEEVKLEYPQGLSSVAIQAIGWDGPIGIADLDVTVLRSADTLDSGPLSLFSNPLYASTWAPGPAVWGDKALDWRYQPNRIEGDSNQMILVETIGGRIWGFNYYPNARYDNGNTDPGNPVRLPSEYMYRIDDSRVILFGGRPPNLYVDVGGASIVGSRDGQSGDVLLVTRQSDNILELLPKEGMDIRLIFIDAVLANGDIQEGFFQESIEPGVLGHESPVGGAIDVTMRVESRGLDGGSITAEIYVSSDLSPDHILRKTLTTVIGANKLLTLRFRVELPGYRESAYAYVRIVGADGTVLAEEGAGHVGRNSELSPKEIRKKEEDYAEAMAEARQKTIDYWLELGKNPAYAEEAKAGLQETLGVMRSVSEGARDQNVVAGARYYVAFAGTSDSDNTLITGEGFTEGNLSSVGERSELPPQQEPFRFLNLELSQRTMVNLTFSPRNGVGMTVELWRRTDSGSLQTLVTESRSPAFPGGNTSPLTISRILEPGSYTIFVRMRYTLGAERDFAGNLRLFSYGLEADMTYFSDIPSSIEGKISLDGSNDVMNVSMRTFQRDEHFFDSSEPLWLVIHGRNDTEDSPAMQELSRSIYLEEDRPQVVTIDWSDAARDNFPDDFGLQGDRWITAAADWVVNQLLALGFSADNVNVVGHSWGAYFANKLAQKLGHVDTLIALDPARYVPVLSEVFGSRFDTSTINFANYSNRSLALLSSNFGDKSLVKTADVWLSLESPEGYENHIEGYDSQFGSLIGLLGAELKDEFSDAFLEHGFAVTVFSAILNSPVEQNDFARHFSLNRWSTGIPDFAPNMQQDAYTMDIQPYADNNAGPTPWWKALPLSLRYRDALGNWHTDSFYP